LNATHFNESREEEKVRNGRRDKKTEKGERRRMTRMRWG
jgi:hypothetical protein